MGSDRKKDNEEKLRNQCKDDRKSIHSHNVYVLEHVKPNSFSNYVSAFAKADIVLNVSSVLASSTTIHSQFS